MDIIQKKIKYDTNDIENKENMRDIAMLNIAKMLYVDIDTIKNITPEELIPYILSPQIFKKHLNNNIKRNFFLNIIPLLTVIFGPNKLKELFRSPIGKSNIIGVWNRTLDGAIKDILPVLETIFNTQEIKEMLLEKNLEFDDNGNNWITVNALCNAYTLMEDINTLKKNGITNNQIKDLLKMQCNNKNTYYVLQSYINVHGTDLKYSPENIKKLIIALSSEQGYKDLATSYKDPLVEETQELIKNMSNPSSIKTSWQDKTIEILNNDLKERIKLNARVKGDINLILELKKLCAKYIEDEEDSLNSDAAITSFILNIVEQINLLSQMKDYIKLIHKKSSPKNEGYKRYNEILKDLGQEIAYKDVNIIFKHNHNDYNLHFV